jgi:hypothetical protein
LNSDSSKWQAYGIGEGTPESAEPHIINTRPNGNGKRKSSSEHRSDLSEAMTTELSAALAKPNGKGKNGNGNGHKKNGNGRHA